jgi:hypothetical protein
MFRSALKGTTGPAAHFFSGPIFSNPHKERAMTLGTILIIVLIIILLGGFSGLGGAPFYGTGYYGGGGLGLILVIVIILVLLGRL